MREWTAVPGKRQECHLSAVMSNRNLELFRPKIGDMTAECSNKSSSKAGHTTMSLLARNREVKVSL